MAKRRDIVLDFIVDDKDAARKLDNIDRNVKKTGDGFGKAAGAIAVAFGTVAAQAVMRFGDQMVDLAIANEANRNRSAVVFGEMAGDAEKWADAHNEAMGMGKDATLGMLAATGDLLVPMGMERDLALETSQQILLTADALSVWTGGKVTAKDATEKITKALLGERDGLVELGIKLSDAEVKSLLLAKGQEGLTGQALQLATAQVSLDAIMQKSGDALAAAESGTSELVAARKEFIAQKEDFLAAAAEMAMPAAAEGFTRANILALRLKATWDTMFGDDKYKAAISQMDAALAEANNESADGANKWFVLGEALVNMSNYSSDAALAIDHATESLGLSAEETEKAAAWIRRHYVEMGFSKEEADELTGALDKTANKMHEQGRQAAFATRDVEGLESATDDLTGANADLSDQLGLTAEAQRRLTESQQAIDPLLKLIKANENYETAARKVNEMQARGETASNEYRTALLELTTAQGNLTAAQLLMSGDVGKNALQALKDQAAQAGLTKDQIRLLVGQWYDLAAAMGSVPAGTITTSTGSQIPVGPQVGTTYAYDEGGIVPGPIGSPQMALVHGGETILPTHKTGGGGGGSVNVYVAGTVIAERDLAETIRRELTRISRRG